MSSTHPVSLGDYQDQVEGMIEAASGSGTTSSDTLIPVAAGVLYPLWSLNPGVTPGTK